MEARYSARRLARTPGFTAAAVLILAVGIGGNSAIFSLLRDAILADPPYPEPERLVLPSISHVYPTYTYHGASYPEFEMLLDVTDRLVDPLAGYAVEAVTLTGVGDAERIAAEVVTPDYFHLLGVSAAVGRTFTSGEGNAATPSMVAILGHGVWSSRFGSDPGMLGREIFINGHGVTVIGVLPRGFRGVTGQGRLWLPMAAAGALLDQWRITNHGAHWVSLLGRLRHGASIEGAESQLAPLAQEMRRRWADHGSGGDLVAVVRPFRSVASNDRARASLLLLASAAALVLLIVCANLAGLLLVRGSARTREIAVRLAIGAGRWRVARQCLTECLLVGLMGGVVGLALAAWGAEGLALLAPESWVAGSNELQFLNLEQVGVDWGVALFAVGLSVVTSLLFGLLPAVRLSRPKQLADLSAPLAATSRGREGRRLLGIKTMLVSGQVAVALILLVSAGLMMFSMAKLQRVDTGIDSANLLKFSYTLPRSAESASPHLSLDDADGERMLAVHHTFLERIQSVPGVSDASLGCPPLGGLCGQSTVQSIEGRPDIPESERLQVGTIIVEDSYFETVGARLLRGRTFSATDWREAPQVLILNETAVRELFPNENSLGQRLALGHSVMSEGATAEVVGVVSDILYASPDVGRQPVVYLSSRQVPLADPTFIVRTDNDPFAILPAIRNELRDLNPNVPIHGVETVEALGTQATGNTRLVVSVLSVFAILATVLSAMGLYAVIAHAVSQRNREMGIRIALGAPTSGVLRLILLQGATAAAVGVVVGLGVAWGTTRLLSSLLFGVSATDSVTYLLAGSLLFAVTLLASYLPARRVTRIDPIEVLRSE
jgi:predicted permease